MAEGSTRLQQYRRTLVLTLLLFILIMPLSAQIPTLDVWDKTFGGWGMDKLTSMAMAADGGYVLGGFTKSPTGGDLTSGNKGYSSYWLVKVGANGNKVWDKTYGAGGDEYLTSVIATADGGYLLGGQSRSGATGDKSEASRGLSDFWVIKVDADGNKVWDRTLGGSSMDEVSTMIQTPDGGYLLGGDSYSDVSGDKTEASRGYSSDYWIVKLNPDGSKAWDKTYGGDGTESLMALLNTPDGGYLLGGHSRSGANGDKTEQNKTPYGRTAADYWVVKLDAAGNKVWDKTIGGNNEDYLHTLTLLPDGAYLLGGSSGSDAGGDKSEDTNWHYAEGMRLDYWLVKLSASGEKVWDKTIGGSYEDRLSSVALTADGGFMLGGSSNSGASGNKTDISRGSFDYWVVKLSAEGNKVWDKAFGGAKADYLNAMLMAADGSLLLGGYSTSSVGGEKSEGSRGAEDYWIVKFKETGAVQTGVMPVTKVWDRRFGGDRVDKLTSMVATSDGGYLLAGHSNSAKSGDKSQDYNWNPNWGYNDYWIVKIKADGSKVWDKIFGGNGDELLSTVVKTADGGYLLGGHSNSGVAGDKTAPAKGYWHFWVVKLNADFSKAWDKSYGGPNSEYFSAMIPTPDGGFLLGGSTYSGIGEDKTEASRGSEDYWVIKIDKSGNKEWDKTIGGGGSDFLTSLAASPDGGYLLGGYSASGIGGDKTNASFGDKDYWVVKLNADGSKAWDRTIGGSGEDRLMSMLATQDGNYLLGGYSDSGTGGYKSTASKGGHDYWVIKLHANGYTVWDKTFGGHRSDYLASMVATADGGILLAGNSDSDGDADKSEVNRGQSWGDYWVVKLKADGSKDWDKTFGGSSWEFLTAALESKDGSFLIGGYSSSVANGDRTQSSWGWDDYWVVNFRANNGTVTSTADKGTVTVSELIVYPNPSNGGFHVLYQGPKSTNAPLELVLYDTLGRVVLRRISSASALEQGVFLQTSSLHKGAYFLKMKLKESTFTQKVILN